MFWQRYYFNVILSVFAQRMSQFFRPHQSSSLVSCSVTLINFIHWHVVDMLRSKILVINHYSLCSASYVLLRLPDMELGHILWPIDPVTRESSDPETQLTRWPGSIMNSKCRLMCRGVRIELGWISSNDVIDVTKKYSQAKEFLIIIGKSKSSLHGLTSSDFSPTTDT